MDSILNTIKKMLGITEDYTCFDIDLIAYINSVFPTLKQLGVNIPNGFSIYDDSATWDDLDVSIEVLGWIKPYINSRVKLMFDPPSSSIVVEAINRTISEYEWRIQVAVDSSAN